MADAGCTAAKVLGQKHPKLSSDSDGRTWSTVITQREPTRKEFVSSAHCERVVAFWLIFAGLTPVHGAISPLEWPKQGINCDALSVEQRLGNIGPISVSLAPFPQLA